MPGVIYRRCAGIHALHVMHNGSICSSLSMSRVLGGNSLTAPTAENPKIESKCGHHFHLSCIFEWLNVRQTCPVCSRKMEFEELL
jgi:RING-H2 zinc finger domain